GRRPHRAAIYAARLVRRAGKDRHRPQPVDLAEARLVRKRRGPRYAARTGLVDGKGNPEFDLPIGWYRKRTSHGSRSFSNTFLTPPVPAIRSMPWISSSRSKIMLR